MGSFWTSAFGGALAGAGNAAVELGNKYIDEQLAQQRAQVLADLQVRTAGTIREQDDAFRNRPDRVARDRANKVADVTAEGEVRNRLALDAARAAATDPDIRKGTIATETDRAKAGAQARLDVERDETIKRGSDPLYLKAQKALKEAERQPESAGSIAQAALARAQLAALDHMTSLRNQLAEAVATGNKGQEEALREQLDIFESKPGKGDKLRSAIDASEKTIQGSMKVLNDPMASEQAKAEANESVRQARVRIDAYTKQLGIDTTKPPVDIPSAAVEMLRKNPALAADFDAKYGAGAAQKALGAAGQKPTSAPLSGRAARQVTAGVETMSDATLRQIAGIAGHAMQREAQAEIAKREATQEPVDTTGFGFGNR